MWTTQFGEIYRKAVELYASGNTDLDSYFDEEELAFLESIGIRPINVFDYAEDYNDGELPDWETVVLIVAARRDYFLYEQKGVWSDSSIHSSELPARDAELDGYVWLPRIIRKAECFLNGGLCHDIMYSCGGDRRFLRENQIHPADFLRAVWAGKGDPQWILNWVKEFGNRGLV